MRASRTPLEPFDVEPVEDRLQIVMPAGRAHGEFARPPHLLADDVLIALDVLAQQPRRAPVVVNDVAGQGPSQPRLGADEHPMEAQSVAVRLPPHRDHAVVVVGEAQLEGLARRQIDRQRGRHPVGLLLDGRHQPHLPRRLGGPERPPRAGLQLGGKVGDLESRGERKANASWRKGSHNGSHVPATRGVSLQVGLSSSMLPRCEPGKTTNRYSQGAKYLHLRRYLTFPVNN